MDGLPSTERQSCSTLLLNTTLILILHMYNLVGNVNYDLIEPQELKHQHGPHYTNNNTANTCH